MHTCQLEVPREQDLQTDFGLNTICIARNCLLRSFRYSGNVFHMFPKKTAGQGREGSLSSKLLVTLAIFTHSL